MADFYPRPPRGGRLQCVVNCIQLFQFLSTPSARRATGESGVNVDQTKISIHALREEGDKSNGRHEKSGVISIHALREEGDNSAEAAANRAWQISIHALREEGDGTVANYSKTKAISIHALREEGDVTRAIKEQWPTYFYPRPPRGGRQSSSNLREHRVQFLSTPSARRATWCVRASRMSEFNFYPRPPRGGRQESACDCVVLLFISIHALREEGDL